MVKYTETYVGASAYGAPVATAAFEPTFHKIQAIGPSGSDIFISFDGKNDSARIVANGAAGVSIPVQFDVSYKALWARSAAGVTALLGNGFYTRQ